MGHGHHHHHHDAELPAALDLSTPDGELAPGDLSRRGFLRNAGLLGAGAATASVLGVGTTGSPAEAAGAAGAASDNRGKAGGLTWLAGDHHIHTQYSSDAMFRVIDQAQHAHAYGLDWIVITDHGSAAHARIGVEEVNPNILDAREELEDKLLIFQGLEWNIPAAEHGTVFVAPGRHEVAVLKQFENDYDASVKGAGANTPANEALAIAGINFLGDAVRRKRVDGALFLANHPARNGIDSPHEFRNWRDANPDVAVGMEGAPGHQAAGIPTARLGPGSARGFYGNGPSANSFPAYPLESYRTWGGFDWFTSTVGGLWDSLLAEGRPWWITANSDAHTIWLDTAVRGPNSDFNTNGRYDDPVHGGTPVTTNGDFWPGYYSKTHVGAKRASYEDVMDAIRDGRIWVDHGGLIRALDVRVRVGGDRSRDGGTTLGGVVTPKRGTKVELTITIDLATTPNWAQFIPKLARVDVIAGAVTGAAADKDVFTAPNTRVVKSYEVGAGATRVSFTHSFGAADRPFFVRVRGTDGNRTAPGFHGAAVDPVGPAIDVVGDADPWSDLWFYANPIWVLPR
jgi:hypothetical protein